MPTNGYCLRCKTKRPMDNVTHVKMKNGRPAVKGKCSNCETKMFAILPSGDGAKKSSSKKSKKSKKSKRGGKSRKSKRSKSKRSKRSKRSRK